MPTAQDNIALIHQFLTPIRERMDKTAADNSVSFKDTAAASPEAQAKQQAGSTTQSSLGVEQSAEAHNGGATADTATPNKDGDETQYADTAGTITMSTDDKVKNQGNLGPTRSQVITQEQKMARADRLANSILTQIEYTLNKKAACEEGCEGCSDCMGGEKGESVSDDNPAAYLGSEEDKEASEAFEKMASIAQNAASNFYESFMSGMLKRAQDEYELSQSNLPAEILQKMGGVSGILDKVAMEDPGSILPEGIGAEVLPGPEGLPPEGMPPEAGGGEPDMDAIAAELDAAGVTPEDLELAITNIQQLQEAGVPEEEIVQALQELEAGGGEGGDAGMPPEAAPAQEELPPEAALLNEASDKRSRIDAIKAYITR